MEDKQAPYLTSWYPEWDKEDLVSTPERTQLRDDFRQFISNPFREKVFSSEIPFRIAGFVYGRDKFEDGDGIITSYVKEIRRVDEQSLTSPRFEITTQNTVYIADLRDAVMICI